MTIPTIFETCRPARTFSRARWPRPTSRPTWRRSSPAGDPRNTSTRLALRQHLSTRGLANLLLNVCQRLTGTADAAAAIFRLDTSYGGGKTHGLIALAHVASGLHRVPNIAEFIDPSLLPNGPVRVAAFDGEKRRPGQRPGHGRRGAGAYTLGRDRLRPGRQGRLRSGARQRRKPRRTRRRDPAGVVRRRAGVDPARRTVRLLAQGCATLPAPTIN